MAMVMTGHDLRIQHLRAQLDPYIQIFGRALVDRAIEQARVDKPGSSEAEVLMSATLLCIETEKNRGPDVVPLTERRSLYQERLLNKWETASLFIAQIFEAGQNMLPADRVGRGNRKSGRPRPRPIRKSTDYDRTIMEV